MKKVILTESDKKQILSEREQAIIDNFNKTFNSIKRIDENELNEDWKTNVAAGLASAAGGMGAQAQQHQPNMQNQPQQTAQSDDLASFVAKGGPQLAERLVNAFNKNPKAAWQWKKQHKQTSLVDNIAVATRNKDLRPELGNMYNGSGSTPLELVVSFLKTVEGNAYHF